MLLVEPVLKHLLLQPSPSSEYASLTIQLYSHLTSLAATGGRAAQHLLDLLVRLLPLHTTHTPSQLLWVESAITGLASCHTSLSADSRDSELPV